MLKYALFDKEQKVLFHLFKPGDLRAVRVTDAVFLTEADELIERAHEGRRDACPTRLKSSASEYRSQRHRNR